MKCLGLGIAYFEARGANIVSDQFFFHDYHQVWYVRKLAGIGVFVYDMAIDEAIAFQTFCLYVLL